MLEIKNPKQQDKNHNYFSNKKNQKTHINKSLYNLNNIKKNLN